MPPSGDQLGAGAIGSAIGAGFGALFLAAFFFALFARADVNFADASVERVVDLLPAVVDEGVLVLGDAAVAFLGLV